MGMARDLKAYPCLLDGWQPVGHMVEKNTGLAAVDSQPFESGAQPEDVGGVAIWNA